MIVNDKSVLALPPSHSNASLLLYTLTQSIPNKLGVLCIYISMHT